ncbi:MAG: hypothetical protein QOJ09_2643 [Actinomycetota bacterium]|jgi:glycosyltransferase involved in cell wall biosynthesis|nr:hypothetical protein [Actinomycetota bacterium]
MAQLVSVVVPTHNRVERLPRALESVFGQSWPELEVIVVNDGSSDGTAEYLSAAAANEPRLRVVSHGHPRGAPEARNTGIDAATGALIAFLDDDDVWFPDKVRRQATQLLDRDGVGAVTCHHEIAVELQGPAVPFVGPDTCTRDELLWDNFLGSTTFCMWRRDALPRQPRFDPTVINGHDWDLWIQCAVQARVEVIPEVLCRYVAHHGDRITRSSPNRAAGRRRIVEKYGDLMSPACRQFNLARATILDGPPPRGEAKALARLLAGGQLRAARMLVAASVAGRLGDRAGDPGRGARRLHDLVRAATRERAS